MGDEVTCTDTDKKTKPQLPSWFLFLYTEQEGILSSHARTVSWVNPDKSCVDGLHANPRQRPLQQVEPASSILLSGLEVHNQEDRKLTSNSLTLFTILVPNYLPQSFSLHAPLCNPDSFILRHYNSSSFFCCCDFLSRISYSAFFLHYHHYHCCSGYHFVEDLPRAKHYTRQF